MSEQIKLDDIYVPDERTRQLDKNYAVILADGLAEHGLFHPIQVRRTPNGSAKFTLVSGLHRLEAAAICLWNEIEAKIVKADGDQALRLEIEENLRRYDLTVLDRAHAVSELRRLWEKENGEINPQGGRPTKQGQLDPVSDGDREVGTFLASAADRIGVSERAIKRLTMIAHKIVPELKIALHGRAEADNQSVLLATAKSAPEVQKAAVKALKDNPALTLAEALAASSVYPKPSDDPQDKFYSRAFDTFTRMNPSKRKQLLIALGVPDDLAANISRRKNFGGDDG